MKPPRRRRSVYLSRAAITIGFAIVWASPTASDAAEIKILTSRAMNQVLTELAGAFQRASDQRIALIWNRAPSR
jgi:hypothetical protein